MGSRCCQVREERTAMDCHWTGQHVRGHTPQPPRVLGPGRFGLPGSDQSRCEHRTGCPGGPPGGSGPGNRAGDIGRTGDGANLAGKSQPAGDVDLAIVLWLG